MYLPREAKIIYIYIFRSSIFSSNKKKKGRSFQVFCTYNTFLVWDYWNIIYIYTV